jgi:hypothetical protein
MSVHVAHRLQANRAQAAERPRALPPQDGETGMSRVTQESTSNFLLSKLTASDFDSLGELEPIDLPLRFPQERPGEPIQYVYFANSGLSSKVAVTSGGEQLEVGVIGREAGQAAAKFARATAQRAASAVAPGPRWAPGYCQMGSRGEHSGLASRER